MIGNTAVRVYIVLAIVVAAWGGAHLLNAALQAPNVDLPDWSFAELPRQIPTGESTIWQGDDTEMDPNIAMATGARVIIDRVYRDNMGRAISMHTAVFDNNPSDALTHTPLSCYRSAGWTFLEKTAASLKIDDTLTLPVSVTTWQRDGEKVMVVYWYQLGEHVLFDRLQLGLKVRWSLAGRPTWPALIKVMMQIPMSDLEDSKGTLLSLAEAVAKWENQPGHRNGKGMLGTQNSSGEAKSAAPP